MKYYIIAGEASGDLHAAKLMASIKKKDLQATFRCWGGDKMEAEGGTIVKHCRDLAFMGFAEVLVNLRTILGNIRFCKNDIAQWSPDVVILIDYPGFNMRIARFAKAMGIQVFYYIAPQVWAWKKRRVHAVHRHTDLAFVILPFEKAFYAKFGYRVEYVGHPMPDSIDLESKPNEQQFRSEAGLSPKSIVALLPGSRKQELKRILPHMLKTSTKFSEYQFVVAGVSSISPHFYKKLLKNYDVKVVYGKTHDLLKLSQAALVTSGTATLETGLLNIPQVVCYRMNFFSALIAGALVHVKYISLVNLILDRRAVAELIQYRVNQNNIAKQLTPLLTETPQLIQMLADYTELREKTGGPGASARAAEIMLRKLHLE